MKTLSIIIATLIIIASCKSPEEKQALKEIEDMEYRINSIVQELDSVNIDSAIVHYQNLKQFQKLLPRINGLSVSHKDTIRMLRLMGKLLKNYPLGITKYKKLEAEATVFSETINNLHHDVSHGLIPEDSLFIYIEKEKTTLRNLEILLDNSSIIFSTEKRYQENEEEMYRFYDHIMIGIETGRLSLKKTTEN